MAINGVATEGSLSSYAIESKKNSKPEDNTSLDMSDFYTLMAAQFKYQDMDNPADTSQMMSMMVQSQMIQAITNMSYMNTTSYAASLVDKQVTVAETDSNGSLIGDKTGVVTGVVLGDDPLVFIDGKGYKLSQIMSVGEVADEKTDSGEGSGDDKTE